MMTQVAQRTDVDSLATVLLQLALLIVPVVLYFWYPVLYVSFVTDDQFGEFATFASFGVASLLLGICFLRSRAIKRRIWFAALAVLAFLVSMEEVSWGQRMVGIGTPDFFEAYNAQGELGFHNIRAISPESTTYFVVAGAMLLYSFLPVLYRYFSPIRRTIDWFAMPLPTIFLMPILIGTAYFLAVSNLVKSDEIGEYFLGLSILLLSVHWLSDLDKSWPRRFVLSLIALLLVALAAGGFTKIFGSEGRRISRLHSTADRMIEHNHSRSALVIMQHVQARREMHRPDTNLILARALRAEGEQKAANSLLLETAVRLRTSLEAEFSVPQALLLSSIYAALGENHRAKTLQLSILTRLEKKVETNTSEGDDLADLLIDVSDAQRTLGRNEEAVESLLAAARSARTAKVTNKIEYRVGSLANLCEDPALEDDERRIPRDKLDSLERLDWPQFCQSTEKL